MNDSGLTRIGVHSPCMTSLRSEVQAVAQRPRRGAGGFTLIELIVTTAIIGTLAAIAVPQYHSYVERTRIIRAAKEIRTLEIDIATYLAGTHTLPPSLANIGRANLEDPWGNRYQYLIVSGARRGDLRKDRFLVPINSDYDLYSMGPDGRTQAPLSSRSGRDDIVRANDGAYVGSAFKY